jgi:hypothetical protein
MTRRRQSDPGFRMDWFSGTVADLKSRDRTDENILATLRRHPRVSCFDRSEFPWLEAALQRLLRAGKVREVGPDEEPYPWCRFVVLVPPPTP